MFSFVSRIAAVLLLVVAGTLAPAAAAERPFNASGDGYVPHGQGNLFGSGKATHLGHSRLSVDLDGEDFLGSGLFLPIGGSLTSASGDQLFFSFDAEYYLFDPAIGVLSATLIFTSGTGRFQDAQGSADVMFVFNTNYPIQHFDFLIDGSIDY